MTLDMHVEKNEPVTLMHWLCGAVLVATVGTGIIYSIINGSHLRAAIESQRAEEVEQENREFCGKFGMAFGTPVFAICANDLGKIRRQQAEWLIRDSDEIL